VHLAEREQGHDVRMGEPRGDQRLAAEALAVMRRGGDVWRQHLDRHEPLERALQRQVDGAHPAASQQPLDRVLAAEGGVERPAQGVRHERGTSRGARTAAGEA
jgi:hypothetical protein